MVGVAAIPGQSVGDLALRIDDAMPGNGGRRTEVLEDVADEAGAPWHAGHSRDLAVGGDPTLGDAADDAADGGDGVVAVWWNSLERFVLWWHQRLFVMWQRSSKLMVSVSPDHREAVCAAIAAAFGTVTIDAVRPVGGGASGAFPFRVDLRGRRYLVRVEGEASPLRNPHQYQSMRIAAEAGIAPRLYHVDEASRVAVMDFIEEQPLSAFPGASQALAQAIGELLARVQRTPSFPRFVQYPDMVSRLWAWVCQTGLFAPGVLDPCTEHLQRVCETYEGDAADSVSSHNDPVPRNILFDGRRLWLIDWESAYANDPLVDVAILLDSFAQSTELEAVLLRSWLGRAPDEGLLARLPLVQALTRLYYAGVFLSAAEAALGPLAETGLCAPSVVAFRRAVTAGELEPEAPETKLILGKLYVASFLTGDRPPGFALT